MGVTYIPGPEQILAPAFQQIAQGLQKVVQPNKEMEELMMKAFATNPDLLQKFADLEKTAPGTAQALGLGRLASVVGFVPQSAEAEVKQALKPRAKEQAVAAQSAEIAKDTFTAEDMEGFRKYLKENPNATVEMYKRRSTGMTTGQEQLQEIELAGRKIQLNEMTRVEEIVSHLPPVDALQMVKDAQLLTTNPAQVDGNRISAYMANPVYAKTFTTLLQQRQMDIDNRRQQESLGMQREQLNISRGHLKVAQQNADQRGGSNDQFMRNQAQEAYEKSGYSGTLSAWQGLLYDKNVQKKASDLLAGTAKPVTIDDHALLDAAQHQKAAEDYKTLTQAVKVNAAVSSAMSAVEAAESDSERTIHLQALNSLLSQRANLGGPKIMAKWADRTWPRRNRVEFVDGKGKTLKPEAVGAMLADPEATDVMTSRDQSLMSGAAASAVAAIKATNNPAQQLAALKMQDPSPGKTVSKQVEAELRRQGVIK